MSTVSIIILTYNSSHHVEKLFKSLKKNFEEDIESGKIEIVVVDNKSSDDTVSLVRKSDLKTKIVENYKNAGFAAGINLGAKNANGKYLVFLNPDAEFSKGSLLSAFKKFEEDTKIGVMGGAIKTYSGLWEKSAGKFINTFEVFLLLLGLDETFGVRTSPQKITQVDFVSGGFMLVEKEKFESLGRLDEDFFMYIEDMEFCYRVKKAGYKVVFNPEIEIVHQGQGSSSRGFAVKNIFRGLLIFQKKHGNIVSYILVKLMLTLKAALLVILGKLINNKYLVETYSHAL